MNVIVLDALRDASIAEGSIHTHYILAICAVTLLETMTSLRITETRKYAEIALKL